MKRGQTFDGPDDYVASLDGWQLELVRHLREAVLGAAEVDEQIKWGHLVYMADGPALLIRAEGERVLFGFWRGQRMTDIEPRLKPGGKYEMATIELRKGMSISSEIVRQLAERAVELNRELGDPRDAARKE